MRNKFVQINHNVVFSKIKVFILLKKDIIFQKTGVPRGISACIFDTFNMFICSFYNTMVLFEQIIQIILKNGCPQGETGVYF